MLKKVPNEKAFYFFTSIGNYTGEKAHSLEEFLEKVKQIDVKSIEFHLYRGDFTKWVKEVLGIRKLAEKIDEIQKLNIKGETLRIIIYETASKFLEQQA